MNLINIEMRTVAQNWKITYLKMSLIGLLLNITILKKNHSALFSDTTASLCILSISWNLKSIYSPSLLYKITNKIFLWLQILHFCLQLIKCFMLYLKIQPRNHIVLLKFFEGLLLSLIHLLNVYPSVGTSGI